MQLGVKILAVLIVIALLACCIVPCAHNMCVQATMKQMIVQVSRAVAVVDAYWDENMYWAGTTFGNYEAEQGENQIMEV